MKVRIRKGTTLHGKPVNPGDVVDLDEGNFIRFTRCGDAEPYTEPAPAPKPVQTEEPKEEPKPNKGKKI